MGGIAWSIEKNHFGAMKKHESWGFTYWAFDLHSTIIKPNYESGNIPSEFYPFAKQVLQEISKRDDIVMIIYTCSHPHEIEQYKELFEANGIHFKYVNENPEVLTDRDGYGYYEKKFYFNVLFEDKAGFDAENDWYEVARTLKFYDIVKENEI
jgi:hypothetical protein